MHQSETQPKRVSTKNGSVTASRGRGAGQENWYRGQMHVHTYWSDGRGFPEQAVEAYRQRGYDFLSITDHNRFGDDPGLWREVDEEEGPWPPKVSRPIFNSYEKAFGKDWVETRMNGNRLSVRIKTYQEIKDKFEVPGKFIIMPGVEFTQMAAGRHVHLNYINLPTILPCIRNAPFVKNVQDINTAGELIDRNITETLEAAAKHKRPCLLIMNHPFWPHYDIKPGDIIGRPGIRFLEICSDGAGFKPHPEALSYTLEKFWDIVNSFRRLREAPLVYGIGSEDAHFFDEERIASRGGVDYAWTTVRAESLSPESLIAAMHKGDFYVSTGVALEDIVFDGETGTLRVRIKPSKGVNFRVDFITTKKNFSRDMHEIACPARDKTAARAIPVYSDETGRVVKSISGTKAEYRMMPDDLYVRARIESDIPLKHSKSFALKFKTAWTQPYY